MGLEEIGANKRNRVYCECGIEPPGSKISYLQKKTSKIA